MYDAIQVLSVDEVEEACSGKLKHGLVGAKQTDRTTDVWNNSDGDLPSDSGSENLLASP